MDRKVFNNSVIKISNPGNFKYSNYKAIIGRFGIPEFYQGGFAITYHLQDKNHSKDKALRVWINDNIDYKDRLKKISDYLKDHPSRYFVKYEYITGGLKFRDEFNGKEGHRDVILMDWINGKKLFDYINDLKTNALKNKAESKMKFYNLSKKVKDMFKWLHVHRISHGDLQHNNIMVTNDGEVVLCDYDSVYVPNFKDEDQVTKGYLGYQHPLRENIDYKSSFKDDYFSEIIIYSGLLALSIYPFLWNHGDSDPEQYFILTQNDFKLIREGKVCPHYNSLRILKAETPQEEIIIKEINSLLDLLVDNLKCDDYEKIRPIPGLDNTYCSFCGTIIVDEFKYCPKCGCNLSKQKVYYEN